jgi:hypothetical protein
MREMRNLYKIFVRQLEGKKPLGTPLSKMRLVIVLQRYLKKTAGSIILIACLSAVVG